MTYTIKDVEGIIPTQLTKVQEDAIVKYLNEGTVPPSDGCVGCDNEYIRKLISVVKVATSKGLFPPKRTEEIEVTTFADPEPVYVQVDEDEFDAQFEQMLEEESGE